MIDKYGLAERGYVAIIEDPDGRTFEQPYLEFEDIADLIEDIYGPGYKLVAIY